jgi:hypothetical protein
MVPHWTLDCAQSIGVASGAHWLFVPPTPQAWPSGQLPQLSSPPQPSDATPQLSPSCAHVTFWQVVQTCETWSQTLPPEHVPQSICVPQPLSVKPQPTPRSAHWSGVQISH